MRQIILVLMTLLVEGIVGFVCFSEYEVSWCIGPDCSNSYTFSASHFHNKLLSFYKTGRRPPVKEAQFILRTPPDFLQQLTDECPALPTLAFALLAHLRASLGDFAQSQVFKNASLTVFHNLKPLQQQIMDYSWPLNQALTAQDEIINKQPVANATVLVINAPGCGQREDVPAEALQNLGDVQIDFAKIHTNCNTDFDQALMTLASDELVTKYDFVFIVTGHEQPAYLAAALKAAATGSLDAGLFLSLGSERTFMRPNACVKNGLTASYFGGSFLVSRSRLNAGKDLIRNFLANKPDGCDTRSVVHLFFGENAETPLHQDDTRLPAGLRLKHGDEHVRNKWTDVEFGPVVPSRPIELPERGRRY